MDLSSALSSLGEGFATKLSLAFVILFCRIGACLMFSPGFASVQIPVQIRLYVVLSTTFALMPLLIEKVPVAAVASDPLMLARIIVVETLFGGLIGILGRIFLLALEAMMVGVATMLGFSNPFGIEIEPNETLPPITTFISMTATALIFFTDMHWEILRGLVSSYQVFPVGEGLHTDLALRQMSATLVEAFRLSLRVASPFFIYAVTVNLAMSLISRLTPQIAIFYISTPFILMGGFFLAYFTIKPLLGALTAGLAAWVRTGG
jgi:flagellar biosynthesis protein FliR